MMQAIQRRVAPRDAPTLLAAGKRLKEQGRSESARFLISLACDMCPDLIEAQVELYRLLLEGGELIAAQALRDRVGEGSSAARMALDKTKIPQFSLGMLDEATTPARRGGPLSGTQRVLYVLHNSLPYASGGYATRGHGLAGGLKRRGFDIHCLTRPGFPIDTVKSLRPQDVPALKEIDGIPYYRSLTPLRETGHSTKYYSVMAANAIEHQARMIKPDCILAASAYVSALPALVAARRIGIPFVYEVRGLWEVTRYSARPELYDGPLVQTEKMLETHIAKHADAVLTLTGGMRDELALRGIDPEKITIVPNSCNPENFAPSAPDTALRKELGIPEGVATIGYIGTFVQYEGLDDLVLACSTLSKKGLDFRLLLVGSENTASLEKGPIRKKVESIAKAHGIEDKLIMPGRVPHEQVKALYSLIDIAPFPRKPQPVTEMVSPMKPLEALAMEKAVIVSSVQALAEMVQDEETGLVFEKGSVSALADTLERLIADPALRNKLGKAGRAWVQRERSWDRTADKAAQILWKLSAARSQSDGF